MKPPQSKDVRRDLPREFQGNYVDPLHFIDSWGDRATDGIVYGGGTPKDGYLLVRALYTDAKPSASSVVTASNVSRLLSLIPITPPLLRVGRKRGLVQAIHAMGGKKPFLHDPYLVKPEVLSETGDETNKTYRLRWVIDGDKEKFIEGEVVASFVLGPLSSVLSGKTTISYDLAPSEECLRDARFAELGLALFADGDRVDWVGDGPLTCVPESRR